MEEIISVNASLVDPSDTTEVNVVAAVVGVGTTHRLASGHTIKWTADFLRAKASTFIGKPVNIVLNAAGEATDHSRRVIGAIKEAHYDEDKQAIMVTAALWGHYYPETIKKIRSLFASERLNVSMEFSYPSGTLTANEDGTQSPTDGSYSGMGFVGKAGDPRSTVYLMAALEKDDDEHAEASVSDVIKEIVARLLGKTQEVLDAAPLSTDTRSDLPDSSFACPEQRKYPVKHKDGSIDLPHLRNAVARVSDPNNDQCGKDTIMSLAKKYLNQEETAALMEAHAAHEGSFEWLRRALGDHLVGEGSMDGQPSEMFVIATYPNYAIYQEGDSYFRIDFKRSGEKLNFGEPQEVDPVYQPTAKASVEEDGVDPADDTGTQSQGDETTMTLTPDEALAAKDEQIEELKATLDAVRNTLNEMKAAQEAREADEKAEDRANERMAELEKIVPVKDELKPALHASLKALDDSAYEVVKASFAASAEIRAGIAPGDEITNPDPTPDHSKDSQKVSDTELDTFRKEAQAQFGTGQQSEDKE